MVTDDAIRMLLVSPKPRLLRPWDCPKLPFVDDRKLHPQSCFQTRNPLANVVRDSFRAALLLLSRLTSTPTCFTLRLDLRLRCLLLCLYLTTLVCFVREREASPFPFLFLLLAARPWYRCVGDSSVQYVTRLYSNTPFI